MAECIERFEPTREELSAINPFCSPLEWLRTWRTIRRREIEEANFDYWFEVGAASRREYIAKHGRAPSPPPGWLED